MARGVLYLALGQRMSTTGFVTFRRMTACASSRQVWLFAGWGDGSVGGWLVGPLVGRLFGSLIGSLVGRYQLNDVFIN